MSTRSGNDLTVYFQDVSMDKSTVAEATKGAKLSKNVNLPSMIGKMRIGKAMTMCKAMKQQVEDGGVPMMGDKSAALFHQSDFAYSNVKIVVDWMKSYNLGGDRTAQAISLEHLGLKQVNGSDDLKKVVDVYNTCFQLIVPRAMRGDGLRDAIITYTQNNRLSLDDLIMIRMQLDFDRGLLTTLIEIVVKSKYSDKPVPELYNIENYCYTNGLSNKWSSLENDIFQKHEKARPEKEAAEKATQTIEPKKAPVWVTR